MSRGRPNAAEGHQEDRAVATRREVSGERGERDRDRERTVKGDGEEERRRGRGRGGAERREAGLRTAQHSRGSYTQDGRAHFSLFYFAFLYRWSPPEWGNVSPSTEARPL